MNSGYRVLKAGLVWYGFEQQQAFLFTATGYFPSLAVALLLRLPMAQSALARRTQEAMKGRYSDINAAKANFDSIYVQQDPRGYFSVLGSLDYMIPDLAEPIVRQLLQAWRSRYDRTPLVLDVGCSYGINAAVHRFPVSFSTLRRRYARHEMAALAPEELAEMDRHYYSSWPDGGLARFAGLDVSSPAIEYATRVGLIEQGIVADLEAAPLPESALPTVGNVDLIMSTGCVGYVTSKTFRRLLEGAARPPWVISFVLRMFPFDAMATTLAEHGLKTERFAGVIFAQRRFRDLEEFESSLAVLNSLGIDTSGFEGNGLLHADLYVSRPAEDIEAARLEDIVTVASGRNRPSGTRFVHLGIDSNHVALEP